MQLKQIVLGALSASAASAFVPAPLAARVEKQRCGAPGLTAAQKADAASIAQEVETQPEVDARTTTDVDVYFHVVAAGPTLAEGYVPEEQIAAQYAVLNDNFAPSGLTFNYKGLDYTINELWAYDGAELEMKKKLRKGSYRALNLYFQVEIGGNLGYCYFPTNITSGSDEFYLDGCSILYTTVPGGSEVNYNEGKTVTHEVGHWFGLEHTFEGGCAEPGDGVKDTPAQAGPTSGCPIGRDSCPAIKGLDPIHNYMDYSYDACYEEFTKGQKRRMKAYWRHYRTSQDDL